MNRQLALRAFLCMYIYIDIYICIYNTNIYARIYRRLALRAILTKSTADTSPACTRKNASHERCEQVTNESQMIYTNNM